VVEAASTATLALAAAVGLGAGALLLLLRATGTEAGTSGTKRLEPSELLEPRDFVRLRGNGSYVVFSYAGQDPRWLGSILRLRADAPEAAVADAAATRRLGGRFAAPCEVVRLNASDVSKLGVNVDGKAGQVLGLRIADAEPPQSVREGPTITLELRPGFGLLDLYGRPGLFRVQDDSLLRKTELARAGRYEPQDFFSTRPDRPPRALAALAGEPRGHVEVLVDGRCIFPGDGEGGEADANSTAVLGEALQKLGLTGLHALLELLGASLQGEGATLLSALLRAQCCAGASLPSKAGQLWEVLEQRGVAPTAGGPPFSDEELGAVLERGFWATAADESGMHMREREAERLLERARRELWVEGSASRRELEAQIRRLLCLYALGCAASRARLQLSVVRGAEGGEATLRRLRFAPAAGARGLWCRLELRELEVPSLERALSEGVGL